MYFSQYFLCKHNQYLIRKHMYRASCPKFSKMKKVFVDLLICKIPMSPWFSLPLTQNVSLLPQHIFSTNPIFVLTIFTINQTLFPVPPKYICSNSFLVYVCFKKHVNGLILFLVLLWPINHIQFYHYSQPVMFYHTQCILPLPRLFLIMQLE